MVSVSATKPHPCPCGNVVDARGLHGLSCKRSAGRPTRHQQLNDVIWRAFKERTFQQSSNRQAWFQAPICVLTACPLFRGKEIAAWRGTQQPSTLWLCLSCPPASTNVGSAPKAAAERKTAKYSALSSAHIFIPVAVETLGPINEAGDSFLAHVGWFLSSKSDDPSETFFLFQRISVIIQRFNEIAFRGPFIEESYHDE